MINLLNGANVLVTRPAHQAEKLSHLIEGAGGVAIRFPTLAIVSVDDPCRIQSTLSHLDRYQWLVFISANAVSMYSYYTDSDKMEKLKSVRIAAIGKATAQALAAAGLPVDLVPETGYNSEALLAMPQMQHVNGQRFLVVRGEGGREELADTLGSRGANVEYLDVYKRTIPGIDGSQVSLLIAQDKLDAITITSGEVLKNLLIMLEENHQRLFNVPVVAVSGRIGQIAADIGFKRIAVAHDHSDAAIFETVTMFVTGGLKWPN